MKVACFSVAAIDYFPQQNQYYAGGNALNQSVRFSNLGASSTFIGAIGNDEHGKKIYSLLVNNRVDVEHAYILEGKTANNRIVNDASGERFGEEGAWSGGVFDCFRINDSCWRALESIEIWTTHSSCPNFDETLKRKRSNFLCVDYLHLPDFELLSDTVQYVDIAYVGGSMSMEPALTELSLKTSSLIVLTLGSEGSIAIQNGEKHEQPALPTSTLDTTGCGDAFQAGFTHNFVKSQNIPSALLSGAKLGQSATQHFGGVPW